MPRNREPDADQLLQLVMLLVGASVVWALGMCGRGG